MKTKQVICNRHFLSFRKVQESIFYHKTLECYFDETLAKYMDDKALTLFEDFQIRRKFDEETETWYFSVVDIIAALIQQHNFQTARNYWKVLKNRLAKEGSESVTKCNRLKLEAKDGKRYLTDVADTETFLRLIQSVPSLKAESIKLWLAKVGYERLQDMNDPARSLDRTREYWQLV